MKQFAVAIDGPAGSGKSTIAKQIAKNLGLVYIDTGAMYRAIGYYCIQNGISTKDQNKISSILNHIHLEIELEKGEQNIYLNGINMNDKIRSATAGAAASDVAGIFSVREKLVQIQRSLAKESSVIMDGRDIGTNVLPDAQVKFFLTASIEERAKRRKIDLERLGQNDSFENVKKMIQDRDYQDTHREYNPLKKAEDAIELDTTGKSIKEVVEMVTAEIHKKI